MINNVQAAKLLGCKTSEIASIGDSPAGVVISTTDGTGYVIVPDDLPDHEGKTGLMLLAAPSDAPVAVLDGHSMWNGFPLFASNAPLEAEAADVDTDPLAVTIAELEELEWSELKELATTHDVKARSKADIIVELAPLLVAAAEAAVADATGAGVD